MSVLFDGLIPVVFISPSGDDDIGTGTYENPWKTMAKAGANTGSGDIIGIKNGVYYGIEEPTPDRIWVGESFGGVFYDGQLYTTRICRRLTRDNLPNKFINIGWRNINSNVAALGQAQFPIASTQGVYFKNCIFKCITILGSVDPGGNPWVSSRCGLFGYYNTGSKSDIKCEMINCFFDDLYLSFVWSYASMFGGLEYPYITSYKLINCVIRLIRNTSNVNTCLFGGFSNNTNAYITIKNTIISNEQSGPLKYFNSGGTVNYNLDIDNNCVYNFTLIGPNDFNKNPKFIEPNIGDFRLQTNSPCLGMGVNPEI